jgi:hypothetical protein
MPLNKNSRSVEKDPTSGIWKHGCFYGWLGMEVKFEKTIHLEEWP